MSVTRPIDSLFRQKSSTGHYALIRALLQAGATGERRRFPYEMVSCRSADGRLSLPASSARTTVAYLWLLHWKSAIDAGDCGLRSPRDREPLNWRSFKTDKSYRFGQQSARLGSAGLVRSVVVSTTAPLHRAPGSARGATAQQRHIPRS